MSWVELVIHTITLTGITLVSRAIRKTHLCTHETQALAQESLLAAIDTNDTAASSDQTIKGLNQRLLDLETEIRLQKSDSSRLAEWLDKRDRELLEVQARFAKHLNLDEREEKLAHRTEKIVEIGEKLRLIRK